VSFMVIPKHFVPPMVVNLALGSVLWATYSEAANALSTQLSSSLLVSALSGGIAGGTQALLAAPAENVRFLLEGGNSANGWYHAWREVFRGSDGATALPREAQLHEARQVRAWMKEVGEMAGRGWNGWGWGVVKDTCGFTVFFALFELTRWTAVHAKMAVEVRLRDEEKRGHVVHKNIPRVVHALTLVSGGAAAGLAYELTCRPWDMARKYVHINQLTAPAERQGNAKLLLNKIKEDGPGSFFRNPLPATHEEARSLAQRRLRSFLRTLARVGPWGIGFLVWESFGPGIS